MNYSVDDLISFGCGFSNGVAIRWRLMRHRDFSRYIIAIVIFSAFFTQLLIIKTHKMKKSELIEKWTKELEMYKRVLKDPLMHTKEDRLKASGKALVIVSMLADVKELKQQD